MIYRGLGQALNSIGVSFQRQKRTYRVHSREEEVKIEVEFGVMHLPVKEHQKLMGNPQVLGERHDTDSFRTTKRNLLCQYVHIELQTSRGVRNFQIPFLLYATNSKAICYGSPRIHVCVYKHIHMHTHIYTYINTQYTTGNAESSTKLHCFSYHLYFIVNSHMNF